MTLEYRVAIDIQIRTILKDELDSGRLTRSEIIFLLTRMLAEIGLADRAHVMGQMIAAFDLAAARAAQEPTS